MTRLSLVDELAAALGCPKYTTKAVLTLEVNKLPTLELEMIVTDGMGRAVVEEILGEYGESVAQRLAKVRFMLRLERFPDVQAKPL